ncbi:lectin c-type domain-containing protein [Ditylenchus destructor]|uniref:Lectin c-type domain-containing protein n=1 Tax=Ditylenchus destructor TaxID=166010 RepID=A0AAD4R4P8_9BILA|nr:lectin c-type domain-containing protein [Ditylenchus destructor]
MIAISALILILLRMTSARNQSIECPDKWVSHSDKCFQLFSDIKHFDQAEQNCKDVHQGALAVFRDKDEFQFIVRSFHSNRTQPIWIGLQHDGKARADTKPGDQNRYTLIVAATMKVFDFNFTSKGYGEYWNGRTGDWEPNGKGIYKTTDVCEDETKGKCVVIRNEKMSDECCSDAARPYICQRDPGQATTPSASTDTTPSASAMPQPLPGPQGQFPVPGQYPIVIPYPIDETYESCWLTLLGLGEELCPRKK